MSARSDTVPGTMAGEDTEQAQLADRLAEAQRLLRDLRESGIIDPDTLAEGGDADGLRRGRELLDRLNKALALPPLSPTRTIDYHIGRSWRGMENHLEKECPCPKEPCGLVAASKIDPECPQHSMAAAKTIRQNHYADDCPGKREDV